MKHKPTTRPPTKTKLAAFRAMFERLPLNALRSLTSLHACEIAGQGPDRDQLTLIAGVTPEILYDLPRERYSELESSYLTLNTDGKFEIRFRVFGPGVVDTAIGVSTEVEFSHLVKEASDYEAPIAFAERAGRMREAERRFTMCRERRAADLRHLIAVVLADRVKAIVRANAKQRAGKTVGVRTFA